MDRKFDTFSLKMDDFQLQVNEKSTSTATSQNYEDDYVKMIRVDKWIGSNR